jgi:uncharacterized RDD family membrane protein YckC
MTARTTDPEPAALGLEGDGVRDGVGAGAIVPAAGLAGVAENPEPVGAVVRLVAYALDALLLVVVIYVVALVLRAAIGPTIRFTDADGVPRVLVDRLHVVINAVAATLVAGAWFVGSWLRFGGTPGQRILGMRVVRVDGSGRLGPGQAVGRWLLLGTPLGLLSALLGPPNALSFVLVMAIALWFALLYVSTARGRRKRGLHDRITGSVVVRRLVARPAAETDRVPPPAS